MRWASQMKGGMRMKKYLLILLCASILLSASAHAEVAYDVWTLKVTDIVISQGEQSVHLHPTIESRFGLVKSSDHGWIQIAILLDGEELMTQQIEYDKGKLLTSATGAQDCVFIADGDHYVLLYSMTLGFDPGIDAQTALSSLRSLLESPEAIEQNLASFSEKGVTVQSLGESMYGIHAAIEGYDVQCKLQWARSTQAQKPYDFSGKNMVRLIPFKGILGGSDIGEAFDKGMMRLMNDDTMAELMTLLQSGLSEQQ